MFRWILYIFLTVFCISSFLQSAPCYTEVQAVHYYSERYCSSSWWGWCTRHRYRTRARYSLRRRCCHGYTGSNCDTPMCSCQNGGVCVAPNVCSCPAGYAGNICQTPRCHPACQHGHCVSPDRCNCNLGYTGAACSQPLCNPPCQSGGTCVSIDTCQCPSNQAGPQCSQPLCNPACLNGGVCSSGHVCDCSGTHYTGSRCEIPVCNPPCQSGGTCVSPNTCQCPSSHAGPHCDQPLCNPVCLNGGVCTASHTCDCTGTQHTGTRCEIPICSPVCQNGGTCVIPDRCACTERYTGRTCDIPLCNPECVNGGVCSRIHTCNCSGTTYTGIKCETPVCNPACRNGGTCVSPNICDCPETYRGVYCEIPLCSYHDPCFPGVCSDMLNCRCTHGFSGEGGFERCKTFDANNVPTITKCSSVLRNIERTGEKREMYQYVTDSSEPNSMKTDMLWLNQKDFNFVNVQITAMYIPPDGISAPTYIRDFAFGIVGAYLKMDLHKVHRNSSDKFVSLNSTTYPCPNQPGSRSPNEAVYTCNIIHHDFDRLLEDGDNLTLTVMVQNGGYRDLQTSPTTNYVDLFKGRNSTKSMMYRFDFRKPQHCIFDANKCSVKAFTVQKDITKDPIQISWEGWTDVLSGIEKYVIEIYFLKPNQNINPSLTEPDPWSPSHILTFNTSQRGCTYIPQKQGMLSLILNVVDRANNSEYARMLVLYDNTSSITIDNSSPMISTSAVAQTNYQWQNNLTNDISISWKGHFRNKFHDDNKLLSQVTDFRHFDHDKEFQKVVPYALDDNDGERTLNAIQNVHGIINFDYAYGNANQGNKTPTILHPVNDLTQTLSFFVQRRNGDTLNIWIRATDSMGNKVTDIMHVYFDETPPTALSRSTIKFTPNSNSSLYTFSSRLRIDAHDQESGIFKIDWEFISNHSRTLFKSGSIHGNKTENKPHFNDGYKVPMGDFFFYSHYLEVNNCWMIVPKESFYNEFLRLKATVYNRAMESTSFELTLISLASLHGIDEYSSPINLHVEKKYDNSVRLRWTLTSTCYERTKITLSGESENGEKLSSRVVDKNADYFDVTGLKPETIYNVSFVTEYGDQKSNPVFLVFRTTLTAPAALTAGGVAGVTTGVTSGFLVFGIIVLVVVVRKKWKWKWIGKHDETSLKGISETGSSTGISYPNSAYEINDELYEEVGQPRIPSASIKFESQLKDGKFASIYKIIYLPNGPKRINLYVAKVIRDQHTSEKEEIMREKIKFHQEIGKHKNILEFLGPVLDDKHRGPYMILEYCNTGQLNIWLKQNKDKAQDGTFKMQLLEIVKGVCSGMLHLETKKKIHRRLAARNILLTTCSTSSSELIPKIYGFCPTVIGNEQIPIRSAALEYFKSPSSLTSKSDVWSFGIFLWETFSLGDDPYPGMARDDIENYLNDGHRLEQPELADEFYYTLMLKCWHQEADQRPTFHNINKDINKYTEAPLIDFEEEILYE